MSSKVLVNSLLPSFPQNPVVFEWHSDTFIDLLEEAEIIAGNEACTNQAFIYKGRVFRFQFHLEDSITIIMDLIVNCAQEMIPGLYVKTADEILSCTDHIEENNRFVTAFLEKLANRYEKEM